MVDRFFFLFILFACFLCNGLRGNDFTESAFAAQCEERLTDNRVIRGDAASWFFSAREIKQLSLRKFWEKSWEEVARNQSNPIPSMVEFNELLKAKQVDLLIVPIPAKATIYPDKFARNFEPGEAQSLSPFIDLLKREGLNVIDLEPYFLEERAKGTQDKFWCEQDAHFSPMACVKIADLIAQNLEDKFGLKRSSHPGLKRSAPRDIEIVGDLVAYSEWENQVSKETLTAQFVGDPGAPVESDIRSPILLLGDSHTLVFSDEESFHCDGAGLFDHLCSAMGQTIDLEGSASGGLVTSRINLYRKVLANPGYWDRKRVVVWVFTAREFTQSSFKRGFVSVPIERRG